MKQRSSSFPISPLGLLAIAVTSAAATIAVVTVAQRSVATAHSAGTPSALRMSAAEYSDAVSHICTGSLLFDHQHEMGTRDDALEVAQDIRNSTARRLASIATLPVPLTLRRASARWISSQRRLAAMYADLWVRTYDTIDAAQTQAQRSALPKRLHRIVHAPDSLKLRAGRLELRLRVPDCTGGG